jgi:hypothetical protein
MTDVVTRFKAPKKAKKPGLRAQRAGTPAALKRRATNLHSLYVRMRDKRCRRCGTTTGQLQCAHGISRRYSATRTDENAAVCLCATCHRYIDSHPFEAVQFWSQQFTVEGYAELRQKAYAGSGKVMKADFWRQEIARLEELLRRVSA